MSGVAIEKSNLEYIAERIAELAKKYISAEKGNPYYFEDIENLEAHIEKAIEEYDKNEIIDMLHLTNEIFELTKEALKEYFPEKEHSW